MAISAKLLGEDEYIVVSTRTHWKALIFPVFLLLVVAAGAYVWARRHASSPRFAERVSAVPRPGETLGRGECSCVGEERWRATLHLNIWPTAVT